MTSMAAGWRRWGAWLSGLAARNPRRVLTAVCTILVAAVIVVAGAEIVSDRHAATAEAGRTLARLSGTLADQMARTMQGVDLVLASLDERIAADGILDTETLRRRLSTYDAHNVLQQTIRTMPQIDTVFVLDAAGALVGNARAFWPVPNLSLADREDFIALRDHPGAGLFISLPMLSPVTGERVFAAARRINGLDGEFLGVVGATLNIRYLEEFYAAVSPGPSGSVSLFREDGVLLVRYPPGNPQIGRSYSAQEFFELAHSQGGPGAIVAPGMYSRQMRLMAPHAVRGYPLVVNLSNAQDAVLESWRQQSYVIVGIAAIAISLIVLLGLVVLHVFGLQAQLVRSVAEQERADRARVVAELASQAKSGFLANMSHELRTPLNAIIGFTEMLTGSYVGPLNGRQAEYVGDIGASGRHLLALINSILDMARVEAGKYDLIEDEVEVLPMLEEALAFLAPLADKRGIKLQKLHAAHMPLLRLDRRAILQVILNLLNNAVKFTEATGVVTLSATTIAGDFEIAVTDTGIGIGPDRLPDVFEPFQRIDAYRSRIHGGSGLGLSISKMIVERHGGRLAIESRLGVGTTVTIRIPAARVLACAKTKSAAPIPFERRAGTHRAA